MQIGCHQSPGRSPVQPVLRAQDASGRPRRGAHRAWGGGPIGRHLDAVRLECSPMVLEGCLWAWPSQQSRARHRIGRNSLIVVPFCYWPFWIRVRVRAGRSPAHTPLSIAMDGGSSLAFGVHWLARPAEAQQSPALRAGGPAGAKAQPRAEAHMLATFSLHLPHRKAAPPAQLRPPQRRPKWPLFWPFFRLAKAGAQVAAANAKSETAGETASPKLRLGAEARS